MATDQRIYACPSCNKSNAFEKYFIRKRFSAESFRCPECHTLLDPKVSEAIKFLVELPLAVMAVGLFLATQDVAPYLIIPLTASSILGTIGAILVYNRRIQGFVIANRRNISLAHAIRIYLFVSALIGSIVLKTPLILIAWIGITQLYALAKISYKYWRDRTRPAHAPYIVETKSEKNAGF
ncbi:MAG: hypothetical protein L6R28_22220 [Planctomycetes bacterium]|nr:hypothetical protein [Planctomycetota bacterium]